MKAAVQGNDAAGWLVGRTGARKSLAFHDRLTNPGAAAIRIRIQ